jgi:FAD/FMN-containing dehydrogenase
MRRHERAGVVYGHFGEGCLHVRIDFDFRTPHGVAGFRTFVTEAARLVVAYGGSPSGEHGDGQARAELLPQMYSPAAVRLFEEFKAIWDPGNRLNPGMVVHPLRIDDNQRRSARRCRYTPSSRIKPTAATSSGP